MTTLKVTEGLASLIARTASSGEASQPAVTSELKRLLDARRVEVLPSASDPASRDPASERLSITAAGRSLGILVVERDQTLSAEEQTLISAAADLLGILRLAELKRKDLETQVSERVKELADQRSFIEKIIDSLPTSLHVVDRQYLINAWNHKREIGLEGVSRTEAVGRSIFDVLNRQPREMLKKEFDDTFDTGRLQQFQMESDAYGETRTFRISKIPMRLDGEDQPVTHVITIGEDITDWKAAIDRSAQAEKLAALGQLAAGVMHEMNNPLAVIAASAEALALERAEQSFTDSHQPDRSEASSDFLKIIDLEVQRCKKIVDGLLDFSRPGSRGFKLVDMNTVVAQALFLLKHHPRMKRVALDTMLYKAQQEPLLVHADSDQMVQVLIALVMNALDASADGGRIRIETRRLPDGLTSFPHAAVALFVSDDGPGIPRALQARVFEPFFTTKLPGKGTGLGLSICYGIVHDHGGLIELESSEGDAGDGGRGSGTTFRVLLPASMAGADAQPGADAMESLGEGVQERELRQ